MSKRVFVILNIVYFGLWIFGLPHFSATPVFGWMPFQLFAHWLFGIAALIIWGVYLSGILDRLKRYDSKETGEELKANENTLIPDPEPESSV